MRAGTAPLVPPEVGRVSFSLAKALWLWANVALAALAVGLGPPSAGESVALVALTFATLCVGHSVGLHRGMIHGTYELRAPLRRALVALFSLTGLGGPLTWIRLHHVRDHWQNRPDCPRYFAYRHGLVRDLWWNLHLRFEPAGWARYAVPQRWEEDRQLHWLERYGALVHVAWFALLTALFSVHTALWLGPFRVAGGILGHWFIGYWTHRHGARRFHLEGASEEGTNSLVLGWISFGEGFHNNHHAWPESARMGFERRELDVGWLVVRGLERLGWIRGVKSWCRGNAGRPRGMR